MIMRILAYLIPHFITRLLIFDQRGYLKGVFLGKVIGDELAIELPGVPYAKPGTHIDVALGISWFGRVIFFWVKDSFDRKPIDC